MNEETVRTWLRGELHARPAGALARLVSGYDARVRVLVGEREADGSSVLDLLALGAGEGDCVEVRAAGPEALAVVRAAQALIERNFDQARGPQRGPAVVPGIAIGRAVLLAPRATKSAPLLSPDHEQDRATEALVRARADLALLMDHLEPDERALFAPEEALLDAIEPRLFAAIRSGKDAEEATEHATSDVAHDLMLDARARLLDALDVAASEVTGDGDAGPFILVVRALTPTLVARLSPEVAGLVVLAEDAEALARATLASHAVLLARGRGLPLAFVGLELADAMGRGVSVIVDATGEQAEVWIDPDAARLAHAEGQRTGAATAQQERAARAEAPLRHFALAVRANVSSLSEVIPSGAEGVGLLRTELLFTGRSRPPTLTEQVNALARVVERSRGHPVTIRLFDGGADKPLAWLPQPSDATSLRGIGLLFEHPDVLLTQLRAIAAVSGRSDVRVLVPMTRHAGDIERVKSLAKPGTRVGAMIESAAAVDDAESLAVASDFLSIGTNDLASSLASEPRESGIHAPAGHVFREVHRVVVAAGSKQVTVCGELAAETFAALALAGLGVHAISVAPSRFLDVKLALLEASAEDCQRYAKAQTA